MAKLAANLKRRRSEHAECSYHIRKLLKQRGIKASVRCDTFSGGTSVHITLIDPDPREINERELDSELTAKYQYGHFDGMTDCYNYDNGRPDTPQVKYICVQSRFSTELYGLAKVWGSRKGITNSYRAFFMEDFWAEAVDRSRKSRDDEHSEDLIDEETDMVWAVANKETREIVQTYATRSLARQMRQPGQIVDKEENLRAPTGATAVNVGRRARGEQGSTRVTMKDRARTIVGEVLSSGGGRAQAIERLGSELGMSKPYASTYFYLVK